MTGSGSARYEDLCLCCDSLVILMLDANMQPGREDWVRSEHCQAEMVAMVRDEWMRRTSNQFSMFPWRSDFVVLQFIRARKKTVAQKQACRRLVETSALFDCHDIGSVYAIQDEHNRVKIGWTSGEVINRLRQLQTGSSESLSVVGSMRGSMTHEKALHCRFAESKVRSRGEWFYYTADLRKYIEGNFT